jgi:hypothetical protein
MADQTEVLLEMMKQMRDDFRDEREASRKSRAVLHERIDGMSEDLGAIRGDIRILGEVDGQVRGEVKALSEKVDRNQSEIAPTVESWRDLLRTGRRVSLVMGIAGLSFAGVVVAIFTWFGETLPNLVRHWLRIG